MLSIRSDFPLEQMDQLQQTVDFNSKQFSIRLLNAVSAFEDAHKHNAPTLKALRVMLYIYFKETCQKLDIEKDLDLQYATCSRILGQLEKDGGFIERFADPENYRKTKCRVTEKGIQLIQSIANR